MNKKLHSLSEIRHAMYSNETPIYYVDHSNYSVMGMEEWVGNIWFLNYTDCFRGNHSRIISPSDRAEKVFPFDSWEEMTNYLLKHPEIRQHIRERGPGKALFMLFDEETEQLCRELDLEIMMPSAKLRREVDDKINSTRIADRAKVASVPNILTSVCSYQELQKKARDLGPSLVIQTQYGDSGDTTYFISNEQDWDRHCNEISSQEEVKVMKRIRCFPTAVEACITRSGVIVGPMMSEIVGFPQLTPRTGGWAGNEISSKLFDDDLRIHATDLTQRLGAELLKLGYRGYFELDFLLDLDDGKLYLGEINPRLTGASSMTNLSAFAHADAPLFLFHILEFSGIDFELDVSEINRRWSDSDYLDDWSQLVLKNILPNPGKVVTAAGTGVWQMQENESINFLRMQTHRRTVNSHNEAFFLNVARENDAINPADDLGILFLKGGMLDNEKKLNSRAHAWIKAIREQFTIN